MREGNMTSRYQEVYQSWQNDPLAFWAEAAKAIDWIKPPKTVFDPTAGRLWPLVPRRRSSTPATTRSTAM